jgi:hypothetical protein
MNAATSAATATALDQQIAVRHQAHIGSCAMEAAIRVAAHGEEDPAIRIDDD